MSVNSVDSSTYSFLNSTSSTTEDTSSDSLGLDDFMTLMTTQLQNQDPLNPADSSELLNQITSIATVTGISDLQDSFATLSSTLTSSQALQGSSLVGRSVLIASSVGNMTISEGMSGKAYVSDAVSDLSIKIYDESGELVKTIDIGSASGYTDFTWDGTDENGDLVDEGLYQFTATGTVDDVNTAFATGVYGNVSSVYVGSDEGLIVNLEGIGSVLFSEVEEII